jgi:hypothetical protein
LSVNSLCCRSGKFALMRAVYGNFFDLTVPADAPSDRTFCAAYSF